MSSIDVRSDHCMRLAELRRRIGVIERGSFGVKPVGRLQGIAAEPVSASLWEPFGRALFDEDLFDQTLARPALHELVADGYGHQPAVRDFSLALIASLQHRASLHHRQGHANAEPMVLWCQRQKDDAEFGRLYGPGLINLGLSPEQLIMVTGRRDADCLWAMEQGLRSRSLPAVIGVVDRADLVASRRLSLAASDHRAWCLLLLSQHGRDPSAAMTRWRIKAVPSVPEPLGEKMLGRPRWQLTLERCRNGRPGCWIVEWDHAAYRFRLVTSMADRSVVSRDSGKSEIVAFEHTG